ncbi:hypothetical protein FB567DRAFT_310896 [Paraphoma chrysanthemicola]|uniref:BTB domain-containing protein n=1 Tax=Paraphoma chrysanthemicola TaxID=798071 RepID=A0A8K0W1F7_9PLEO|nr:hypothetical protein FB567DRAFT_310896 [Paraphoma chrysanthemicola]
MAARIDFAKRGDVLLELGTDEETKVVVSVYSVVLGLASPVFEAMFNGNFAEGQTLSTTSPRAVPLPEDDQESMILICKIAHLQTAELPQQLSVDQLAVFATTCDKYQCGAAVQAWSQVWIAKLLSEEPAANFEQVVFATYVLDMPLEFYKACTILTRTEVEDTKIFALDYLPSSIFDALRSNRRRGEMQLYQSFHGVTQYLGTCKASRGVLSSFFVKLKKIGAWPVTPTSIESFKDNIAKLMEEIPQQACSGNVLTCGCVDNGPIKAAFVSELEGVCNRIKGICLDCIKREALGDMRECRISHNSEGMLIG